MLNVDKIVYYFELFDDDQQPCGERMWDREVLSRETPQEVVARLRTHFGDNLQVVYHESDTPDGRPFITDYEAEGNLRSLLGSNN